MLGKSGKLAFVAMKFLAVLLLVGFTFRVFYSTRNRAKSFLTNAGSVAGVNDGPELRVRVRTTARHPVNTPLHRPSTLGAERRVVPRKLTPLATASRPRSTPNKPVEKRKIKRGVLAESSAASKRVLCTECVNSTTSDACCAYGDGLGPKPHRGPADENSALKDNNKPTQNTGVNLLLRLSAFVGGVFASCFAGFIGYHLGYHLKRCLLAARACCLACLWCFAR